MKPTQVLKEEHRLIERVLMCLERAVAGDRVDVAVLAPGLEFVRGFADALHHRKEEDVLFPLMERRGFRSDVGPCVVMRAEHEDARAFVAGIERRLQGLDQDDPASRRDLRGAVLTYAHFLREHIRKEDACLFPMADNVMTEPDAAELMRQFALADARDPGAKRRFHALADELAARVGLEPAGADRTTVASKSPSQ